MHRFAVYFAALFTVFSVSQAMAACPGLSGGAFPGSSVSMNMMDGTIKRRAGGYNREGSLVYNRSTKSLQVCNGSSWVDTKPVAGGNSGGSSACPAGTPYSGNKRTGGRHTSRIGRGMMNGDTLRLNTPPGDCCNRTGPTGWRGTWKCSGGRMVGNGTYGSWQGTGN